MQGCWSTSARNSRKNCCTGISVRSLNKDDKEAHMSRLNYCPLALTVTFAFVVLAVLLVSPASAQKASTPLRTPDGKPDLQGIWTNNTVTPLERPKNLGAKEFYTDQELADLTKRARQGGNDPGEEVELGAARQNDLRYDLELYGFDRDKVRFSSKRTSLIVVPEGTIPPMLPEARKRNANVA